MSDDPIPLFDGELSGAAIVPERSRHDATTLRGHRSATRRSHSGIRVCFSPELRPGRPDHVECNLIDISATGAALEYDQPLAIGVAAHVAYRTACDRPIRVQCTVRGCLPLGDGRFRIGVEFAAKLRYEDCRPRRFGGGGAAIWGLRARKLPSLPPAESCTDDSTSGE